MLSCKSPVYQGYHSATEACAHLPHTGANLLWLVVLGAILILAGLLWWPR